MPRADVSEADPNLAGLSTDASDKSPLARLLDDHFTTPVQHPWRRTAPSTPERLVFLLDHSYTERGLRWSHLKADDAPRANALRSAAERADCAVALSHAAVQETWDCFDGPPHWDDDRDGYATERRTLGDLINSSVTLTSRAARYDGASSPGAATNLVDEAELAMATPSMALTPCEREYTGYMGNYGNTEDRWYTRAAVVVWPQALDFVVRARQDPIAAVNELLAVAAERAGCTSQLQHRADDRAALAQRWDELVDSSNEHALAPMTLRLARVAEDPAIATALVTPLSFDTVITGDVGLLLRCVEHYGLPWFQDRLEAWTAPPQRRWNPSTIGWAVHAGAFAVAIDALGKQGDVKANLSRNVLAAIADRAWQRLGPVITAARAVETPSRRLSLLQDLASPTSGLLRATALAGSHPLHDEVIERLCEPGSVLVPLLIALLENSDTDATWPDEIDADALTRHCVDQLNIEVAQPPRAPDNWFIPFEHTTCCQDCAQLAEFLGDATSESLVWPLAKPRRQHIHRRIDAGELPVTHVTRREGSPHKLVLTKTSELFKLAAARRGEAEAQLCFAKRRLDASTPA